MKKNNGKFRALIILCIVVFVLGVIGISYSLHLSKQIREFDTELQVLDNEVSVGLLNYNGQTIRLTDQQISELCLFPRRMTRSTESENTEILEEFSVNLVHGDSTVIMDVKRLDTDLCYVSLTEDGSTVGFTYRTNSETDYDDLIASITNSSN